VYIADALIDWHVEILGSGRVTVKQEETFKKEHEGPTATARPISAFEALCRIFNIVVHGL
jgi:hypothetical protein